MLIKVCQIFLIIILSLSFSDPTEARGVHHRRSKRAHTQTIGARSALIWDITNDHRLFSKNADMRVYPASTTKIMTVLLALEHLPLDAYVTVSQRATQVEPTKLDFIAGEQYRVRDLIYACLLKSANDAAGVLAEAIAGSQKKFVAMMNQKAWEIGARHTRFANPHGLPLPAGQHTTARDMAMILKEALKDPFFYKAITFRYRIIYSRGGRRHFLKSHNKALFLDWKQDVYGKTGYTRQAGTCFVGFFKKGNGIFIVDVFGSHKRWEYLKWIIEHYAGADL